MVNGLEHTNDLPVTVKRLTLVSLGLIALQPISAGFWLSGYEHSSTIHAVVAVLLQLVAFAQSVTAVVLWRRRRITARVAGACVALLVLVFLEAWAGRKGEYWLHLPMGVGILVWLRETVRRRPRIQ